MELSHMKRQSFYYHFSDVYEVLEYTCTRILESGTVRGGTLCDWYESLLDTVNKNRSFFKRVLDDTEWTRAADFARNILARQISHYFPESEKEYIEFASNAVVYYLMDRIAGGKEISAGRKLMQLLTERSMCLSTAV